MTTTALTKLDKRNAARSQFNRRLYGLMFKLLSIFRAVGNTLKDLNTRSRC